jgi:hypothetical protein
MISKLSLLLRSKLGLVVVGGVLVAAVGATTGLAVTGATAHLLAAGQTPSSTQCASSDHSSSHTSSQSDDDRNERDDQGDNQHAVQGTITSVDTANSSFVLTQCDGTTTTVQISSKTSFGESMHGLADLKAGLFVQVEGILQSNGTFTASSVHVEQNTSGDDHDGSDGDHDDGATGTSTPSTHSGD